jgi:hypothetical protein
MTGKTVTFFLFLLLGACAGDTSEDDTLKDDTDTACEDGVDCPEECTDGVDNDGDGKADCQDEDCADECVEDCFDGVDNDGDSFVDCEDADCAGQCTEDCTDGQDNDGDGLIDCEDDDCDGSCPEVCDDERDNDGDGLTDCEDEDCDGSCPEVCNDGRDNDGDGLTDCEDDECAGTADCVETDCEDGLDNDGDGLIDCEDGDCATSGSCVEDCFDGIDNDGDALIDCLDDECFGSGDCHPDGVIATVQGGAKMDVKSSFVGAYVYSSVAGCSPSYVGSFVDIKDSGNGNSMYGTIQAKPRGATDWVTCDWTVGTVDFSHTVSKASVSSSTTSTSSFGPVTRNNVNVEPGCGVRATDTWFLPQKLKFEYSLETILTESGNPWYQASSVTNTYTVNSGYDSACAQVKSTWIGTYFMKNLNAGSSYLAYE